MSIATKTGDDGNTRLYGGARVAKDAPRIEAYGAVEELNALVGFARAAAIPSRMDEILKRVQSDLMDLSSDLITPRDGPGDVDRAPGFPPAALDAVDGWLTELEDGLPPMTAHLLPGGHQGAALLGLCRAVVRRAERKLVTLARNERIPGVALRYLNRLGDLLFVMARDTNVEAGMPEPEWEPRETRESDDS